MTRHLRALTLTTLVASVCLFPSHAPPARAQSQEAQHVLRVATLIPRNPQMRRGLVLWNRALAARTEGRVQVRMYWGGSMGDERTMVRRMRIGQLDGASMTSAGLAIIHRPVLVMQVPGVFSTYEQVDRVRAAIGPDLVRGMEAEGFALLGWGDSGRVRLFSQRPVRRPSDLRAMRPWVPTSDAIFHEMLSVVGATGVRLSVGEVFGGLRTHMIDVVPGTALAAAGLQWFTSLSHVTAQSDGFLIGGMVVRQGFLDDLSPADREALFAVTTENQERFLRTVRQADERAFEALTRHGIAPVDLNAHTAEWRDVATQTRARLAGRVFPASLLERVERLAAQP